VAAGSEGEVQGLPRQHTVLYSTVVQEQNSRRIRFAFVLLHDLLTLTVSIDIGQACTVQCSTVLHDRVQYPDRT
jgi:hypothetical protein